MFDFLLTADVMVADPDALASAFVERLGVLTHPNWRQAFADHPYVAWFLRVHRSLAVAPTRIEPQGHLDRPNRGDPDFPVYLRSIAEFQGPDRPMKTHATVLITQHIDRVVRGLERRRVPFRIAPMTPDMPWERLWTGVTPESPLYSPQWDAGLCVEILPMWPLQIPDAVFTAPDPVDPEPGSLVRVVAKEYLVRDLDDALRRLDRYLDWEPMGPVEEFPGAGFRRARMGFALPHSATVDLIQPTEWSSETGRYLHTWGPGGYTIRIAVHELAAKAADLDDRGTAFTTVAESEIGPTRLRVDPQQLEGVRVELEEFEPPARAAT
jgi:hypothetical protein